MSGRTTKRRKPKVATDSSRVGTYCFLRQSTQRTFGPEVAGERLGLLVTHGEKWVNGTTLRYAFFPDNGMFKSWLGSDALKDQVRKAFKQWTDVGIGLRFEEVQDRAQAQIRIGFLAGDGHWSYIGRQVLNQGADDRTLNLDPTDAIENGAYGVNVATHEIGHSMSLPHEHQNPNAGIVWNEEAVYAALAAPPNNWDRNKTFFNIIRKIPPDQVQGSSWDPDSIMHYPFEAGLIQQPAKYREGLTPAGGLSVRDKDWVRTFYPPLSKKDEDELPLLESRKLSILAGEQRNFVLKPKATRYYSIATFGKSDTVGVLNIRDAGGVERYLTGDDDGGLDRNMTISRRLQAGSVYVLRLRLYYAANSGETAVMWW